MSKNQNYEEYQDQDDNRPLSIEEQRARLRQLIIMGKERGYITYSEINDALPDDMSDAEQIDNIVSMISGLGIQVTEQAPDAEDILLSDNAAAMTDDDAVEEAEAALSSADSEFGRTTDPVRMYMREMGQVDLLTREDEIIIAKKNRKCTEKHGAGNLRLPRFDCRNSGVDRTSPQRRNPCG